MRRVAEEPGSLSDKIDLNQGGIILAGDSAGGNLACVVSSLARDSLSASLQPCPTKIVIRHQLLIYPALFMQRFIEGDFKDGAAFLPAPVTQWFRRSYLPEAKTIKELEAIALRERRLSPFIAGFEGMPPTTMISAGLDYLRFENKFAAQQLQMAGVDCVHRHVEGVPHGFVTFHFLREARETQELMFKDIMRSSQPREDREWSALQGKLVEMTCCKGARGRVINVRMQDKMCEIDLRWAKAYAPAASLLVL